MATRYGQTIEWTDLDGSTTSVHVNDYDTREEASAAAMKPARYFGWTAPKWWQWWRWNDTRPPPPSARL